MLCKGRVPLELLSRSNNLETQMFLWTLTSSRVAGDSDFTGGEGLSWTWTAPNSSLTKIPIILSFHGFLLQNMSFVLIPCGTVRREAGIRSMKDEVGFLHLQYKLHLCHLSLSKRREGYKPTQNTWQQPDPVFSVWQGKKWRHTASTFPTCGGGNPVSVSLPTKKTPRFQTQAMTDCKI